MNYGTIEVEWHESCGCSSLLGYIYRCGGFEQSVELAAVQPSNIANFYFSAARGWIRFPERIAIAVMKKIMRIDVPRVFAHRNVVVGEDDTERHELSRPMRVAMAMPKKQ